jgi:hypothetical protein
MNDCDLLIFVSIQKITPTIFKIKMPSKLSNADALNDFLNRKRFIRKYLFNFSCGFNFPLLLINENEVQIRLYKEE